MRRSVLAVAMLAVTAMAIAAAPTAGGKVKSRSTKTCDGTFVRATLTNVVVPADGVCRLRGSTVTGSVSVREGAYFEASDTDVARSIRARRAQAVYIRDGSSVRRGISALDTSQVFAFDSAITKGSLIVRETPHTYGTVNVCGMKVSKDVSVTDSGSDILVGDPLAVDCPGNSIGGDLSVSGNRVRVELVVRGNTIRDDLVVSFNRGTAHKSVEANLRGDRLSCRGNLQPFRAAANTGWDSRFGQC